VSPRAAGPAEVIEEAVAALREGRPVVLPVDTVYGLAADPRTEGPAKEVYRIKGTPHEQPIALLARDVETLIELVPELREVAAMGALLPGPYTLVVPNPAERYRWITGTTPDKIGVRVPRLAGPGAEVLEQVGAVAATSANVHGGADPSRLEDVPAEVRASAAAVVDGGELPGTPSTVLDLTGPEPKVLREGAVPGAEAIELARSASGG
jgi:L-threonylcarbamoyladenylate synthase